MGAADTDRPGRCLSAIGGTPTRDRQVAPERPRNLKSGSATQPIDATLVSVAREDVSQAAHADLRVGIRWIALLAKIVTVPVSLPSHSFCDDVEHAAVHEVLRADASPLCVVEVARLIRSPLGRLTSANNSRIPVERRWRLRREGHG